MAHAHGAQGIALAAELGVRSIEHASFIDQQGIDACLRSGSWIVPTFSIGEYYQQAGSATGAQDRMIQIMEATNDRYYNCIRSAVQAGVKVALGSDYVGWDPAITAKEFWYLVNYAHMSPLAAIHAGTWSAAEMLDIPGAQRGQISVGAVADIVIVSGNPAEDIRTLETGVKFVMKGGRIARFDEFLSMCVACKA
jgi:imidazolonepropionase-like amidohydrolase